MPRRILALIRMLQWERRRRWWEREYERRWHFDASGPLKRDLDSCRGAADYCSRRASDERRLIK